MKIAIGVLIVAQAFVFIGCESSSPPPTATPIPQVSVNDLFEEREANATRFDDTYKDKWVNVVGKIIDIDNSEVSLEGPGLIFHSRAVLQDIKREEQAALNVGQRYSAICKVGSFNSLIIDTMYLYSCRSAPY